MKTIILLIICLVSLQSCNNEQPSKFKEQEIDGTVNKYYVPGAMVYVLKIGNDTVYVAVGSHTSSPVAITKK